MPVSRKDPYLNEALEILDAVYEQADCDISRAYECLGSHELNFIQEETERCANYRYYAENYHVIRTKEGNLQTLHPFYDSQEIFYEPIWKAQQANLPVRIQVLKARRLGICLAPETMVLTADLRWMPIGEVQIGQELVATDEGETLEEWNSRGVALRKAWVARQEDRKNGRPVVFKQKNNHRRSSRRMRTAVVTERCKVYEEAVRLTMDDGRVLVATPQHKFLCKQRSGPQPRWMCVSKLRVGDKIRSITAPWENEQSFEDGWFGGLLDGEGCLRVRKAHGKSQGVEVCVAQVLDNGVLDRAEKYLRVRGYTYRKDLDMRPKGGSKLGGKPQGKLVVQRMNEIFRLIGKTKPTRFIVRRWWEGKEMPGKRSGQTWGKIVSVEHLPAQRMIDLQTSTKTFIAEGFVSHNSTICESLIFHATSRNHNWDSLIVAQDPKQSEYLFEMSRLAYEKLPWWLRPESRYDVKGTQLLFDRKDARERFLHPGLRSQIMVESANKLTGISVGKALMAAHFSELTLWPEPEKMAEYLFPMMESENGLYFMESTSRGRHGFWPRFWKKSVRRETKWTPVFIESFRVRKYSIPIAPDEDFKLTLEEQAIHDKILKQRKFDIPPEHFKWRRKEIQEFIASKGDDSMFYQEYPATSPHESFQGTGLCAFDKKKLQWIRENQCSDPIWFGEIHLENKKPRALLYESAKAPFIPPQTIEGGRLYVWEMPEKGATYYVSGDVAEGIIGGNFSAAQVLCKGKGPAPDMQVAEWRGWLDPEKFAEVLAALGLLYNNAEVAPEVNAHGGGLLIGHLSRVVEYENIFRWKHYDKVKNRLTNFLGWSTTPKSRSDIITKGTRAVREGLVIIRSEELIEEMFDFASTDDSVKIEGQDNWDDRVMSFLIGYFCAHDSDEYTDYGKSSEPEKDRGRDFYNTESCAPCTNRPPSQTVFHDQKMPSDMSLYLANAPMPEGDDNELWKRL